MPALRRPSPAMVVALTALIVALAGTGYAAQRIHGGLIKKQTIGGGKLKRNTLTGFQIRTSKLGVVPAAKRATHTYWVVVRNPKGPRNATMARSSAVGINATEGGGAVIVGFPQPVDQCVNVAARNNARKAVPGAGFAQTNNTSNPAAIEVRTRNAAGNPEDADFHLIVVCL